MVNTRAESTVIDGSLFTKDKQDATLVKDLSSLQIQAQGIQPMLMDWTGSDVRMHLVSLEKLAVGHAHVKAKGFKVVTPSIASSFGPDLLETLMEFDADFAEVTHETAQDDDVLMKNLKKKAEEERLEVRVSG